MKLIIYSLETKQIHQCPCGQVGCFKGDGNSKGVVCSRCDRKYSPSAWGSLVTVTVPVYTIPVIMRPEEGAQ